MPRKELVRLSQRIREDGGRVILTNGCFDLLHVGHVRYLREARSLGESLVVGLNSDASVRRLKGPGRPVTNEEERAEVLAALESVDWVTIFGEDTASQLVSEIRPDVYVKGGDYSTDPNDSTYPVEGRVVTGYGGRVTIIRYVPDHSTSDLLRRISLIAD